MVNRVLAQRNARIRTAVMKMMAEKSPQGHQKYTSGYVFDHIAAKYGLRPRTVQNIFWETGVYCMNTSSAAQNMAAPA